MTEMKGYKYRIYPTKSQEKILRDFAWKNNILYNKLIEMDEKHRAWSICEEIEKNPSCPYETPFIDEKGKIHICYKDEKKSKEYKFPYKEYEKNHPLYKPDVVNKKTQEVRGEIALYNAVKMFRRESFFASVPADIYNLTVVENYDKAVKNARKGTAGFPAYKKTRENFSFSVFSQVAKNKSFCWRTKTIQVPSNIPRKPMKIFFKGHRKPRGKVRNATISMTPDGRWFLSVMAEFETKRKPEHRKRKTVGIDFGVSSIFASSDGKIIHPEEKILNKLQYLEEKKIKLQRIKDRKKVKNGGKTSAMQKKIQKRINKIQAQILNIREDWKNKTVLDLCKENDVICRENLKIKNMTSSSKGTKENPGKNVKQKSGLNRKMLSWGPYSIFTKLENKQKAFGGKIVLVDPRYTSQECSDCGHISSENRDGKIFICISCGRTEDADINAAKNILKKGLTTGA